MLVVDGFDRISGSYQKNQHDFASVAGRSVKTGYETVHNSAVVDGSVNLSDYSAVVWSFGDESSTDETFGTAERAKAAAYLQQGGKLFANGSEIAYDLDRASGPSTEAREFFNNFLKADYAGDDADNFTVNGSAGSFLEGVSLSYGDTLQGSPYREDYPDHVAAFGGSAVVAQYQNGLNAATAFTGTFPSGTSAGAVVFLGIPFETIHSQVNRDALMTKVLNYFGIVTSVIERGSADMPEHYSLEQNYPNPFNPSTTFRFSVAQQGPVTLKIYDLLGKEIAVPVNADLSPGQYAVQWNAAGLSSGMYLYRLQGKNFSATKKFVLAK